MPLLQITVPPWVEPEVLVREMMEFQEQTLGCKRPPKAENLRLFRFAFVRRLHHGASWRQIAEAWNKQFPDRRTSRANLARDYHRVHRVVDYDNGTDREP